MKKDPKLIIIIGPTAVGKSSIIDRVLKDFPRVSDLITYTTRPMRTGESEGQPYHFVTEDKFKALVEQKFVNGPSFTAACTGHPATRSLR